MVTVGPVVEISDYRDIELKISIWRQLADLPTRDSEPYIRGEDRKSAFWRAVRLGCPARIARLLLKKRMSVHFKMVVRARSIA